jgi:hypothetical protein
MNKGGFSWKRATGVTRAKQKVARTTGIPLTKSGRQRQAGKMITGGGCLLPTLALLLALLAATCGGGDVGGPTPTVVPTTAATETPTVAPTPVPTATPSPTPDSGLLIACNAISEFRALGDYIVLAANAVGGPYSTWESAVTTLLAQMNRFIAASNDLAGHARFADWYRSALEMSLAVSYGVLEWDTASAEGDVAAHLRGNEFMSQAVAMIDTMNRSAAAWEGDCP